MKPAIVGETSTSKNVGVGEPSLERRVYCMGSHERWDFNDARLLRDEMATLLCP